MFGWGTGWMGGCVDVVWKRELGMERGETYY